jgi:hypothetical protein
MRKVGGGGIPCTARLEDFAHRTDAGRYLNGTIDVAHVGVRMRERTGKAGIKGEGTRERREDKGELKVRTGSDMRFLKPRIPAELIGSI